MSSDKVTSIAAADRGPQRVRENEDPRDWDRRERVFTLDDRWYFHTREGVDVGPYSCQFDAEIEVEMLVNRLSQSPQEMTDKLIRNHVLDAQVAAGTLSSPAFTDYLVEVGGVELLQRESAGKNKGYNG